MRPDQFMGMMNVFSRGHHPISNSNEERMTMTEKLHGVKPAMVVSPDSQGETGGKEKQRK